MTAVRSRIDAAEATEFSSAVFEAVGLDADSADIMAEALVMASLRGVDTHGLIRLGPYAKKFAKGGFNPRPAFDCTRDRPGVVSLDADGGAGPVAAHRGMEAAIELAARTGVGATSVTRSNHFGMAGYYTLLAADTDCIGIAMSNGGPRVAPTGGIDPFFGTNPIAYSVPTDRDFHITHDMSTSAGANAKIRRAKRLGESIPETWAIDASGEPTTDPTAVHAHRPVGDHKGYGLGLFVEICSSILAGATMAPAVPTPYADFSSSMNIGHLLIAIDITAFRSRDGFYSDVGTLIDRLHSARAVDDIDAIRLPGERATRMARQRGQNGIPLDTPTIESMTAAGDRVGIPRPDVLSR